MTNLTLNATNYSTYEKKILGIMIERMFTVIYKECCHNKCDNCSINNLCNDSIKALKLLSDSGDILKFQSKKYRKKY